jgi:hypothetical protein
MFIGHFALGLAAKRATPKVSLVLLFAAAQLADLLWPFFLLVGVEQVRIESSHNPFLNLSFVSYPYSHSLLLLVVWGIALALLSRPFARGSRAFIVISGLVVSHWVLDVLTHVPDMPLYPGGPTYGMGLWNSVPATIAIETVMFAVGVWIYNRTTRPRDKVGRWAYVALIVTLALVYVASLTGAPPPSVTALAVSAIVGFAILILLSWWADAHRTVA